ncbi:hypothetical protein CHX26_09640 [Porphyrobacter sp. HT-58-2]|uniref:hypothetical protein n=1 Tax=Porphyrobacter sp. HT-58-2 TaxID=2023229 RepID=UPI000CDC1DC1|nr:hypothetical protein [Porphyrobacter sp. HT-58-2]AUX70923.1 hypothetical protein CHX26_09640 [Porphyrobacter sp. HT-58-2]
MVDARFTLSALCPVRLAVGGMAAALLVSIQPAAANPAPAGSVIESTAEASYDEGGTTRTVTSNTVEVQVDELLGVAAASLDAGPVTVRSGSQVLSFLVSNEGNGPEELALEVVTAVPGNSFDATLDTVAIDSNSNGVYDPGVDTVLSAPSITSAIPAGGSQHVFVIVLVPGGIGDGSQSSVNLIARTATGTGTPGTTFAGSGENGVDAVVGAGGGQATATGQMIGSASTVTLVKWATVTDPFGGSNPLPGATITYGIELVVTGSAAIDGLTITDSIPTGTQYVANSLTLESTPLTDAADDDAGQASSAGISVTLDPVSGGASRTVTFDVLIEE